MECQNPKLCAKKHERWKRNQEQFISLGEKEHELFLEYLEKEEATLSLGYHADRRQFERVVSTHDVNDIISHGWVIERNFFPHEQAISLVILGYTRTYRPIHVVCLVLADNHWEVKTVYSPTSKRHKWSTNFQERVCFCKSEGEN
ncbi:MULTISPECIES: DUF4258 domain-containing protein [Bacillati]|uniref:DUF4258 domain-containing protein n=1 Tax=Bacillati TaxID=1783272 RepID=UPI0022B9A8EA|nr:DUF4258 domain-containing protein [Caldifermentibacillus hisashii]